MKCDECAMPIEPGHTYYEGVRGWRKRTHQKTTSSVVKQVPTGQEVCRACMESGVAKEMRGQLDIFGDEAS